VDGVVLLDAMSLAAIPQEIDRFESGSAFGNGF
jgi:hypothetical protein